jgi:transcriptional regulator with XRE-family HTH domain
MAAMPAPLRTPNPLASLSSLREVLGYNIRANRVAKKMSQEQLGFAAHLDRTFVSQVERARVNISVDNIEKLAKALGVDPALLFIRPTEAELTRGSAAVMLNPGNSRNPTANR